MALKTSCCIIDSFRENNEIILDRQFVKNEPDLTSIGRKGTGQ